MAYIHRLIVWALLLAMPVPVHAAEPLLIFTSHWPPFTSSEPEAPGFFMEIVSRAFARSDIQVRYEFAPWARALNTVKTSRAFGAIPLARTPERQKNHLFSRAVFMTRNPVIYNRSRNPDYDYPGDLKSLNKYRLGGMLGWFYIETWRKEGIDFYPIHDHRMAFKMIRASRIDLTVFDEFAGRHFLDQHPEFKPVIGFSKQSYENKNLYLMSARDYPGARSLLSLFNANLSAMKKTGEMRAIALKHRLPCSLLLPAEDAAAEAACRE